MKGRKFCSKGIRTNQDVVYVEGQDVVLAVSAAPLQPYARAHLQLQLMEAPSHVLDKPNYRIFKITLIMEGPNLILPTDIFENTNKIIKGK